MNVPVLQSVASAWPVRDRGRHADHPSLDGVRLAQVQARAHLEGEDGGNASEGLVRIVTEGMEHLIVRPQAIYQHTQTHGRPVDLLHTNDSPCS
eukprot:7582191-Pyramimonas_sp.AAC.1